MANVMPTEPGEHLRTDYLRHDLRGRSVRGGAATVGVQVVLFALNLVSTAVMARLLAPRDFGLFAMVAAFTGFLLLFRDLGLSSATVQRAELTPSQVSALFWINVTLGVLTGSLLALAAPLVAWFYGQPELRGVTLALALGFVIAGLGVQHAALLRRHMRFGSLAVIDVAAGVLGIVTAITGASMTGNYWALVYGQLVQHAAATVGAWLAYRWRPDWPPRFSGVGALISFGASLTGFNVLTYLTRNLDNIILGRTAGSIALGFYVKAYSLLLLPVDRIRGPVSAVVIPALSRLQHDSIRFRSYFMKAIASSVALGMPAVVFLFVFADEAILVVLGPQWKESVLLFRVLAPAAFVETFNTVGSWTCLPLGQSNRLIRWQAFATSTMVLAFLVGARWGALGMAVAFSVSTIALRLPAIVYFLRGSPVRPADILQAVWRPACASVAAGATVFLLRGRMLPDRADIALIVAAPVFAGIYLMILLAIPGSRAQLAGARTLLQELGPRSWTSRHQKAAL